MGFKFFELRKLPLRWGGGFSLFVLLSAFEVFDLKGFSHKLGVGDFSLFVLFLAFEFSDLKGFSLMSGCGNYSFFVVVVGLRLSAYLDILRIAQTHLVNYTRFHDNKRALETQFRDGFLRYRKRNASRPGHSHSFLR